MAIIRQLGELFECCKVDLIRVWLIIV